MNALAVPFRQLVERRLWPLAILLVAALAAVPMLLAKSADTPLPGPVASASSAADTVAAPSIVSVSEPASREVRRRVLGKRKNPFEPAVKAKKADQTATNVAATKPAGAHDQKEGGTGGVVAAPVTTPLAPKKFYELYSLTVRFGETSAEKLGVRNLKRLTSLPSVEAPVVIYLGLQNDLKTAVFLVDSAVSVQGDGRCEPDPSNCQTLHLQAGEIAFLDVAPAAAGEMGGELSGKQFQLDFVKVKRKKTTDATSAKRSRSAVAGGGREALRARSSRVGRYRYDARTGTLKRLNGKQLKAEAAARAARSTSG